MNRREVLFAAGGSALVSLPYSSPKLNPLAVVDDDLYWDAQWAIGELEPYRLLQSHSAALDVLHRIPKPG